MRYRKLTTDGDYSFGNGLFNFWIDVPDAVAQAVKTRLGLWTGEWFLDVDEGTPWLISVLGKHSQTQADVTIQDRVNNTQGVVGIENYSSALDADLRRFAVTMTVNTIYGPASQFTQNVGNF